MASDIQSCTRLDQDWRLKMTCCNWNQPSMVAQTAQRAATMRMRLLSPVHGQNATNGAVHAKPQMHQMGLKQATCTKIESGNAHCAGRIAGSTEPTKINTHAAKTRSEERRVGKECRYRSAP